MWRVVEPLLSGGDEGTFTARDLEYVRDLGLVSPDSPPRIANPIYAEVVPRELTYAAQEGLVQDAAWYVNADGSLDVDKLLAAFQPFFREHSEHRLGRLRLCRSRPAAPVAGVPAADRQRRRTHQAGMSRFGGQVIAEVLASAKERSIRRGRQVKLPKSEAAVKGGEGAGEGGSCLWISGTVAANGRVCRRAERDELRSMTK